MIEDKKRLKHTINLEDRERLNITGVSEVLSFDEENVMLDTEGGLLILRGSSLHMGKLDLDLGEICVSGLFDSIIYSDEGMEKKYSFFGKLFK